MPETRLGKSWQTSVHREKASAHVWSSRGTCETERRLSGCMACSMSSERSSSGRRPRRASISEAIGAWLSEYRMS